MNSVLNNRIFFALAAWIAVGVLIAILGITIAVKDWYQERARHLARMKKYVPFTVGRLAYPSGGYRADAFGIIIPAEDPLPKPGEKIQVYTDLGKAEVFTVLMCETLSHLAPGPEEGQNMVRSPEVYILIQEKLADRKILAIKSLFAGNAGFDPSRDPVPVVENLMSRKPKK